MSHELESSNYPALFYQSVDELPEPVQAEIKGIIPKWISGTLLRNGPGKFEVGQMSYRHVFDGLALLQQFVIEDGNVTYLSKFLRSQTYQRNMKAGTIVKTELGTPGLPDPCKNIFARWFSYYFPKEFTDNAFVNFCCIKGKIYAMTEMPIITEVDPVSLESPSRVNLSDGFQESMKQLFSATAHPHEDQDGSVYNLGFGYDNKIGLAHVITQIPPKTENDGEGENPLNGAKVIATLPASRHQAYSHSFGMTAKYFIFIEQPLTINLLKLAASPFIGWSILETFSWDSTKSCVFHVISRENGEVVSKFIAEPFFFFHVVNAHELNGDVIIDLSCYQDSKVFHTLYLEEIRNPGKPNEENNTNLPCHMRRFRLPVEEAKGDSIYILPKQPTGFDHDVLSDSSLELPRINEKYNRLPHRFVYGVRTNNDGVDNQQIKQLIKVDVETKKTIIWSEEGCLVSEPVFIAAPDSQQEDHGVVLSAVCDPKTEKSFLLVLDGQTFTEVGRAEVLVRFAPTLHGRFLIGGTK